MAWQDGLHDYIDFLKARHNLTHEEVLEELQAARVPATTYASDLTPLQATAAYLHENGHDAQTIAQKIGRPARDVKRMLETARTATLPPPGEHSINANAFADKTLSAGEHLVEQLEEHGLTVAEIAQVLDKSEQTIWTQHYRIKEKRGERNE